MTAESPPPANESESSWKTSVARAPLPWTFASATRLGDDGAGRARRRRGASAACAGRDGDRRTKTPPRLALEPRAVGAARRSSSGTRIQPPRLTTARDSPPRRLSPLTRPSRIWTTRSATRADSGSWLTTIVVAPASRESSRIERVDLRRVRRVELAGRLVGDEEPRPVRERGAERDALLLAAGELARERVAPVEQADALEQRVGGALALGARRRRAGRAGARRARAPSARARARACSAGRRSRACASGSRASARPRSVRRSSPKHAHRSGRRPVEPGEDPQQRALAGAARPEDDEQLALARRRASVPGARPTFPPPTDRCGRDRWPRPRVIRAPPRSASARRGRTRAASRRRAERGDRDARRARRRRAASRTTSASGGSGVARAGGDGDDGDDERADDRARDEAAGEPERRRRRRARSSRCRRSSAGVAPCASRSNSSPLSSRRSPTTARRTPTAASTRPTTAVDEQQRERAARERVGAQLARASRAAR